MLLLLLSSWYLQRIQSQTQSTGKHCDVHRERCTVYSTLIMAQ